MKTYKILVIDDAFFIRNLIKKAVGRKPSKDDVNFEIVGEASNGNEGIRMCEELKPDIITVDFNIPELNGLDFAKYLKETNPKIPILMISSNDDPTFPSQVEAIGCHFLPKPFQESFLWIRLDGLVEEIENWSDDDVIEISQEEEEAFDLMKEIAMDVEAELEEAPIELEETIQIPKSQATIEKETAEIITETIAEETPKKKKKKKKKKKQNNDFFGLELEDNFVIKPKTETSEPESTIVKETAKPIETKQPQTVKPESNTTDKQKNEPVVVTPVRKQPTVKPIEVKPIATKPAPEVKPIAVKPVATKPIPVPKINLDLHKDEEPEDMVIDFSNSPNNQQYDEIEDDIVIGEEFDLSGSNGKAVGYAEEPEEEFIIEDELTADVDGELIIIDDDDAPIIIDDGDDEIIIVNNDEEIVISDETEDEFIIEDEDPEEDIIIETEEDEIPEEMDFDFDSMEDFSISADDIQIDEIPNRKRIGLNIRKEVPVVRQELTGRDLVIKTLKENANYSYQNEMSYVLHVMEKINSTKKEEVQLPDFDDEPIVEDDRPLSRLMARSQVTKSDEVVKEKAEEDEEFDKLFAEFNPNIDLSDAGEDKSVIYKEESKKRLLSDAPSISQNIVIEPPKSERIRQMYNKDDVDEDQLIVPMDDGPKKVSIFTKIFNFFSRKKKDK